MESVLPAYPSPTHVRVDAPAMSVMLDLFARAKGVEVCGLLLGALERGGKRVRVAEAVGVRNESPRAHACWSISPEAQPQESRAGRERGHDVVGTWHGHPASPPEPSRADVEGHEAFQQVTRRPALMIIVGRGRARLRRSCLDGAGRARAGTPRPQPPRFLPVARVSRRRPYSQRRPSGAVDVRRL